jgi:hypothetical protein
VLGHHRKKKKRELSKWVFKLLADAETMAAPDLGQADAAAAVQARWLRGLERCGWPVVVPGGNTAQPYAVDEDASGGAEANIRRDPGVTKCGWLLKGAR